jgi:ketosteroid isomerase-like protein
MTYSKNVQLVLDILKNEIDGDINGALEKMSDDYSMTWMYQGKDTLFPTTGENVKEIMKEAYPIKGREYVIKNIAEGENLVMIEVIESYPDEETGQVYRTPQIIVLELFEGRIKTGRHYTDPRLSYENLSEEMIDSALKNIPTKIHIS